eukprot:gnl/MRDRNA2_/MRDRNA2_56470_c0_seq1.p1 gnl/MRDRNA2_/MRDRNA2_56470_c0~~gnl/MRDRNA2_/MRDRNA2_56470_c0_seq1.p1  ORF type:complete len:576 (+),score=89.48 gnl/MRDRNA2_/MRDRNA2_56470_c0_seq1:145-1872(+)
MPCVLLQLSCLMVVVVASIGEFGPLPVTFEAARRTMFKLIDLDEDGQLLYSRSVFCSKQFGSEWDLLFDHAFELQLIYKSPEKLRNAQVPKQIRTGIHRGVLRFPDFLSLSVHALQSIVQSSGTNSKPSQGLIYAKAFLALHQWTLALKAFQVAFETFLGAPRQHESRSGFVQVWKEAQQLQVRGRFLESSWLYHELHKVSSYAELVGGPAYQRKVEAFSRALPHPKGLQPLQAAHPSYANAPYLQALRKSQTSRCMDIGATQEEVMEAIRSQTPARIRGANLLPGVAEWVAAFQRERDMITRFHVSPDGVFYKTEIDDAGQIWAVEPAMQLMKLGSMNAAAEVQNARFYIDVGNVEEELPGVASLIPDQLDLARGLNLTQKNLWAAVGGGVVSLIHMDSYENILLQVHGSKQFTLWPPSDFLELKYDVRPTINHKFFCCPARWRKSKRPKEFTSRFGAADVLHPEREPQLKQTSPLSCTVRPGDALVLPVRWHHLVVSEPGEPGACHTCAGVLSNLAVNYWYLPHRPEQALLNEACNEVVKRRGCDEEVTKQCQRQCVVGDKGKPEKQSLRAEL